jgi:drug/metabolite transporter (DMT)-like permease
MRELLVALSLMSAAILLGAWSPDRRGPPLEPRRLHAGVALGILAMFVMAQGIVIAKPVFTRSNVLWATAVRMCGGLAVLALQLARPGLRRAAHHAFRPGPVWRVTLPGAFLGTYLGIIFWTLGMKLTYTSVASVLNQSSNLFIIILAAIFLGERIGPRQWVALALGLGGGLILVL